MLLCVGLLAWCLVGCSSPPSSVGTKPSGTAQQEPTASTTYVAIGASDTYGTGADDPPTENWPVDLASMMSGIHLINLGVPGIHVHEALNVELPIALDAKPGLVTVWLAVNDLADGVPVNAYQTDFDLLLTRLTTALPHARIAVANVPDLTLLPRFKSADVTSLRALIAAYNAAISASVARHHVLLVDLFARWGELASHPEYISSDGFHPNALGYNQLAQIFYAVLQGKQ